MDKQMFRGKMYFLYENLKEWPSRPQPQNHIFKERAPLVVINNDMGLVTPVYSDDPRYECAKLLGVTEEEFEEAKRIIQKELESSQDQPKDQGRKTMKFNVTIVREEHREHTFEVEADTEDAANDIAMDAVGDYDFHDSPHKMGG